MTEVHRNSFLSVHFACFQVKNRQKFVANLNKLRRIPEFNNFPRNAPRFLASNFKIILTNDYLNTKYTQEKSKKSNTVAFFYQIIKKNTSFIFIT